LINCVNTILKEQKSIKKLSPTTKIFGILMTGQLKKEKTTKTTKSVSIEKV